MIRVFGITVVTVLLLIVPKAQSQTPPPSDRETLISGVVTDSTTGRPVAGMRISARDTAGNYVSTDAPIQSGADGRYSIAVPGTGTFQVTAYSNQGIRPRTRTIEIASGQKLTLDFPLPAAASISGKVIDQEKHPVAGIAVYLIAREYSAGALRYINAGFTRTNANGEYVLSPGEPGRSYLIMAKRPDDNLDLHDGQPADPKKRTLAIPPTFFPATAAIEAAQTVTAAAGDHLENIDIRVAPVTPRCIAGKVAGDRTKLQLRMQLTEVSPSNGRLGSGYGWFDRLPNARINPGSDFRICGLHAGEYELTARTDINKPGAAAGGLHRSPCDGER
jgi:hypothetical protein